MAVVDESVSLDRIRGLAGAHHATWIQAAMLIVAVGFAIAAALHLTTPAPFPDAYSDLAGCGTGVLGLVLFRSGHASTGAALVIAGVWLALLSSIAVADLANGGTAALPLLVAGTALLLGARAAWLLAALTTVVLPATFAASRGWRGLPFTGNDLHLLIQTGIVVLGMATLMWLFLRSYGIVLAKAQASELRFGELFRHSPDGIVALGADGRVAAVNPAAERLLGTDGAAVAGRKLADVLLSRVPGAAAADVARLATADASTHVFRLERPSGAAVHVEATARRTTGEAEGHGSQVVLHDVSARVRAEEAQRSLHAQLQQAQKMEAVGQLAGGVAHDFNNLLMAIGAAAELLTMHGDEKTRQLAGLIGRAKDRGSRLTRQLLTFARKDVIQPRVLSPAQVVRDAEPLLRGLISERIDLDLDLRESRPIVADPGQIEQILLNLVGNARDAMPGGGRIGVEVGDADVSIDGAAPPWVVLRVRDSGAGMDADVRARLFEPFFTTKPRDKGTGLGLATVHGIVTQNGGLIEVESAPGEGSCFTISWPASRDALPSEPAPPAHASDLMPGTVTVLLVEDNADARELLRMLLEQSGYRVIEASDGESALAILADPRRRVDLLLTDVVMPGISGIEVARRVRDAFPDIAVLLMTGYLEEHLSDVGDLTGEAILLKPFSINDLHARIADALGAGGPP
jgi:two-component system, cell cycle sensor histidine kinase and response regulator CckA